MSQFPNLPGIEVEVQDGGLRGDAPSASPVVTVLGYTSAVGLELNTPIRLATKDARFNFLESDGSVNELVKKITETIDAGAQNVQVVVLGTAAPVATGVFADLAAAYDLLLNTQDLDIIVPAVEGVFIDTPGLAVGQNFAYQLANFCFKATTEENSTIGVIGTTSPAAAAAPSGVPTLAETEAWVAALEANDTSGINGADISIYDGTTVSVPTDILPATYAFWATANEALPTGSPPSADPDVVKDKRGNPVDIGAYISVYASYHRFFNDIGADVDPSLGFYRGNGAAGYAGIIASLSPQSAPTNKPFRGAQAERNLSKSQSNRLAGARFVTAQQRVTGLVVVSAMTGAYNIDDRFRRSDFTRLSTVRIVHAAIDIVRAAGQPFIGQGNNAVARNALKVRIDRALATMQEAGALEDYTFALSVDPTDRTIGLISVDVNLVPALEIRNILSVISIS